MSPVPSDHLSERPSLMPAPNDTGSPYVEFVLVSVTPVSLGAEVMVGAFIGPILFLFCVLLVLASPERMKDMSLFSFTSSSPQSSG